MYKYQTELLKSQTKRSIINQSNFYLRMKASRKRRIKAFEERSMLTSAESIGLKMDYKAKGDYHIQCIRLRGS